MLHEMISGLRDEASLRRELDLACAAAGHPGTAQIWFDYLMRQMPSHPLEWPSARRSPSEHTCRVGAVFVHYRLVPESKAVEILSTHGPHSLSLRFTVGRLAMRRSFYLL